MFEVQISGVKCLSVYDKNKIRMRLNCLGRMKQK